jgi:hypothetical protein
MKEWKDSNSINIKVNLMNIHNLSYNNNGCTKNNSRVRIVEASADSATLKSLKSKIPIIYTYIRMCTYNMNPINSNLHIYNCEEH